VQVIALASKALAQLIAVRAKALAYGLATMLACVISVGAAQAQTKSESGKNGKTNYAFVDERSQTEKPPSRPLSTWAGSMDLRHVQVDNGDYSAAIRVTVVHKPTGFIFEIVANERHSSIGRTQTIESYPGFALLRKNGITINGIAGGKFVRTTNLKTEAVAEHFRLLFGAQVFANWRRLKAEIPVTRIEVPVRRPNERKLFAHVSQLLFRILPRWQVGEETILLKPAGLPLQKAGGFMVRFKLSTKAFIEGGWFAQPDFTKPTVVRHAWRSRGAMIW
jgi:hypothetical protein